MKLTNEDQARLEQLIAAGLRQQPTLKAPVTLQSRVMAEIARRAALPWWQRSFGHWPMSMKVIFVLTALVAVRLMLYVTAWSDAGQAATQIAAPVSGGLSFLQTMGSLWLSVVTLLNDLGGSLLHRIPGFWLYLGIGAAIAMYVMLAGIGVAVYRTLGGGAQARA
jgi:hypothetical protein